MALKYTLKVTRDNMARDKGEYIFVSKLVSSQVHCSKRSSTNFLFDHILINPMLSSTIILACIIFGSSIKSFLSDVSIGNNPMTR